MTKIKIQNTSKFEVGYLSRKEGHQAKDTTLKAVNAV